MKIPSALILPDLDKLRIQHQTKGTPKPTVDTFQRMLPLILLVDFNSWRMGIFSGPQAEEEFRLTAVDESRCWRLRLKRARRRGDSCSRLSGLGGCSGGCMAIAAVIAMGHGPPKGALVHQWAPKPHRFLEGCVTYHIPV